MRLQGTLRLRCPAKITPYLKILGKRPDRFHSVRLLLLPVDLFDTIEIIPLAAGPFSLEIEGQDWQGAPGENLVWQAAQAFSKASGLSLNCTMRLQKSIPSGAGLGGGSSDAAAALLGLNHLAGTPLSAADLHGLATGLGSDVPFFLAPGTVCAEGRGERLTPLPSAPAQPLLVVKPPFSIATAAAYGAVADWASKRPEGYGVDPGALPTPVREQWATALHNDFEAALLPIHPELERVREALLAAGAHGALLSGSGSAVFGVFASTGLRDAAVQALRSQQDEADWHLLPCQTLPHFDPLADAAGATA